MTWKPWLLGALLGLLLAAALSVMLVLAMGGKPW